MRLIDADADKFGVIRQKLHTVDTDNPKPVDVESYRLGAADILSLIDEAPTVDAVTVIRCRDCGYAILDRIHKVKVERPPVWRCRKIGRLTVPDGFCHRGKIREEDENATD